jgi:hypothetical protein
VERAGGNDTFESNMAYPDTAPRRGGCRQCGSQPDHFFASAQA